MKLTYENGDLVQLRRVDELSDPEDWGMTQDEYDSLLTAMKKRSVFEITCESSEGYFDIENVDTGEQFEAISDYNFKPNASRKSVLVELDMD